MDKRVMLSYNAMDGAACLLAEEIGELLLQRGISCAEYSEKGGSEQFCGCICMITVGGDGTILHWGKLAARHRLPLLGVNRGRLGFMATLEPSDIARIPDIITGDFATSRRMIMNVVLQRKDGSVQSWLALNDVVAERDRSSKLPEFHVLCGESEVSRLQADGIIFSTPTGSTAYALSAGGSIIAPDMECIEFTPLCPHTLFSRPMIFSAEREISLRFDAYHNAMVTISVDAERGIKFSEGDVLRLSRSELCLEIIEAGTGFFGAVRDKLMTPLK